MAAAISGIVTTGNTLRPQANQYFVLTAWRNTGTTNLTDGVTSVAIDANWKGDRLILTNSTYLSVTTGNLAYSGSAEDIV